MAASGVPQLPGRHLRMGINPAGRAGAIGPPIPLTPIDYSKTLAALRKLRPKEGPFVLRLNRFFWSDGQKGIRHFLKLTRLYTKRGYRVELQLRYHPTPEQEGHIHAWVRFVREVVRRFGPNPRVIGLQVTNEVNFYPIAPDASDSAFKRARVALIHGVEAAHRTVRRRGFDQLHVGFNWAYRTDPSREAGFWGYLRDHGGKRFARSVDWVGLDAYPGTIFPPTEPPIGTGYRDGMVNAMSVLRECYMPIARLGRDVPIHVEENGWPTGPGRSERQQVRAMRADGRGRQRLPRHLRRHRLSLVRPPRPQQLGPQLPAALRAVAGRLLAQAGVRGLPRAGAALRPVIPARGFGPETDWCGS